MSWEDVWKFLSSLTLDRILPALGIVLVGAVLVHVAMKGVDRALSHSRVDKTAFGILKTTLRVLLYGIVFLIALGSIGVDVSSLVAVLSVGSLAVTLAVQQTLGNIAGGITLIATHPFHVGDYIEFGSDEGTVQEINLNYTHIVTADGRRIFIPNSDAASSRVCNYPADGNRRLDLKLSIPFDVPQQKVTRALLRIAEQEKCLPEPEPVVRILGFENGAVQYDLVLWTTCADYWDVLFDVNKAVKTVFEQEGIPLAVPVVKVQQ